MRKFLMAAALLAGVATAGVAHADDDDCNVPMANWQSRDAVQKMAETHGWIVRQIKTDDGCYEIKGYDAQGRKIEVKVDPGTLAIVKTKQKDDEDRGTGRSGAPAGTVAPPNNGLFNQGTKPPVIVK